MISLFDRLQQALKMYDAVQERIAAYDKEILRKLGDMEREQQRGQTVNRAIALWAASSDG